MKRVLGLVVVLILYGSFYPWKFHEAYFSGNPLWILAHSWPQQFEKADARDAAINVALYAPFGAFLFLSLRRRWSVAVRAMATVLAAALLSSCIEMSQLFATTRHCSLFDVLCNVIGGGLGVALAVSFPGQISVAVSGMEQAGAFRASGSIALLYIWAGFELFPFIPHLSYLPITTKLKLLVQGGGSSWRDGIEHFGVWLAVAALWTKVAPGHFVLGISLGLLTIPSKILIEQRAPTASEIAGALLGIGAWLIFRRGPRPMRAAGVMSIALLLIVGLLSSSILKAAQPFEWAPFKSLLSAGWEAAFVILLRKSFLYGSAIWLLNDNGRGWLRSVVVVATLLAIIEGAQTYLPGRLPEITDPLLAVLVGLALTMLERQSRRDATGRGI